jgi:hypothetical protein
VPERGAEKILVVEDDDDVPAMTAATLEELGYRTVIARDGLEALAMPSTPRCATATVPTVSRYLPSPIGPTIWRRRSARSSRSRMRARCPSAD